MAINLNQNTMETFFGYIFVYVFKDAYVNVSVPLTYV